MQKLRMKKLLSVCVVLLVLAFVLAACESNPISPLPTPAAPGLQTGVAAPPPLTDPTNFQGVLIWLAGGGAGAFIAVWIEKQKWFQNVAGHYKPVVVLGSIVIVALIPRVLLDFVPTGAWAVVQPYFATIVTAILVGYPLSQLFHEVINRQAEDRQVKAEQAAAQSAELERQWKILE